MGILTGGRRKNFNRKEKWRSSWAPSRSLKSTRSASEWVRIILWEDPNNYTAMMQPVFGSVELSSVIKARSCLLLWSAAGREYCQTMASRWPDARRRGRGRTSYTSLITGTVSAHSNCAYIVYNIVHIFIKWSTRQRWTQGCRVRSSNKSQRYHLL